MSPQLLRMAARDAADPVTDDHQYWLGLLNMFPRCGAHHLKPSHPPPGHQLAVVDFALKAIEHLVWPSTERLVIFRHEKSIRNQGRSRCNDHQAGLRNSSMLQLSLRDDSRMVNET